MQTKPTHYQVIARKYRPQTFDSVVGQDVIVTTLKNSLKFNRLAHAYLFCGCRGTGKTTLARVFAKALNCTCLSQNFEPCNTCSSCLDINAGRSLDVLEIDGASNRGIDDIRQINETVGYAPASGKFKIYMIDEVHMLTKEAFNALLKTLEEPPVNVKFFFATTEPHKVLPTIISRCQRFDLNRIPFEALKKKLAWIAQDLKVPCEEDVFSLIANLSEGSLRDAESLFDQIICYAEHPITAAKVSATLGLMPRTIFFNLDMAFKEQNLSFAFELADEIFSSGKDLSYFIDHLIEHYRCLLKLKIHGSATFPTARLKEQYSVSSNIYTEEQCLYIVDFVIQWQQQMGKTPFKRVSLEMVLLHVIRSKHRITLPALVRRLVELEQKFSSVPDKQHAAEKDEKLELHRDTKGSEASSQSPVRITAPSPFIPPASVCADEQSSTASTMASEQDFQAISSSMSVESSILSSEKISEKVVSTEKEGLEKLPDAKIKAYAAEASTDNSLDPNASSENSSLEDALLKKIKDKIEAKPVQFPEKGLSPSEDAGHQPSSLLLSKSQWEAAANSSSIKENLSPVLKTKAAAPSAESPLTSQGASQSRYDTLMRFAAVELEGIIKKEQPNG